MNWVDLVIAISLVFFAVEGLGKSLFFETFELGSFALAFFLSLKFYNIFSQQLELAFSLPHSLSNALGFIIVWYLIETVFFILSRSFYHGYLRKIKIPGEEIISIIPAFLRGVIVVAILLVLVGTFPIQPGIKKDVEISKIGSIILAKTYQLEAPLKTVFGDLANDTLTFLTVKPRTNESVDLRFQTNNFYFDEKLETAMINLVNKERVSQGISVLSYNPRLREIARQHSADMLKRGYFAHYSLEGQDVSDRAERAGVGYLVIGENLAYAPSLELAHQGLMNSPGHQANIMSSDFHDIGIGAANATDYGIMFTQVFKN